MTSAGVESNESKLFSVVLRTCIGNEAFSRGGVRQHLSECEHGLQHVIVVSLAQAQ